MYSREQIQQVRSAIDIVDVIREYVPSLKEAGRSVRGLCPFHQEKTPSFHVHPDKGFYKCFGCGASGDVIGFLQQIEQVPFSDALKRLAQQAGVRLKQETFRDTSLEETLRDRIYRLLESAQEFYEDQLWSSESGKSALQYLEKRGIQEESIRTFRLGYAPNSGVACFEYLVKRGFSIDLCQQAGLVSRSKAGRYFDPQFGRMVFPILDNFGHVVGFGGRLLPNTKKSIFGDDDAGNDEAPKYLNSPETPVFSKGKLLYGLFQAKSKIMETRQVLILEGYMDVIGAHQAGFSQAVATLGTALTRDHTKLLKRYANEAVMYFDPDVAGQRAAFRGLEPLLQEGLFPKMVRTEGSLDPDEYILKYGNEAFQKMLDQSPDFVDHMIMTTRSDEPLGLQQRSDLARKILGVLVHSTNDILKSEWTHRVAKNLNFQPQSLVKELNKVRHPFNIKEQAQAASQQRKPEESVMRNAEEEYLQLVINCPEIWNDLGLNIVDFSEDRDIRVFTTLKNHIRSFGKIDFPSIHDELPPSDKAWFMRLSTEEREFLDPRERRDQLVRDIRIKRDKKRLADLSKQIAVGNVSQQDRQEYLELLRRVKGSSRPMVTK